MTTPFPRKCLPFPLLLLLPRLGSPSISFLASLASFCLDGLAVAQPSIVSMAGLCPSGVVIYATKSSEMSTSGAQIRRPIRFASPRIRRRKFLQVFATHFQIETSRRLAPKSVEINSLPARTKDEGRRSPLTLRGAGASTQNLPNLKNPLTYLQFIPLTCRDSNQTKF